MPQLTESQKTTILVVDVQPAYRHYSDSFVHSLCNFLNTQKGSIHVMYNGEGLTEDSVEDVAEYLLINGLNPALENINFIEKEYGFLRSWIDTGVPDRIIIKVIRSMAQNLVNDSRELDMNTTLDPAEIAQLVKLRIDWNDDGIYFPYFLNVPQLKKMSPFYMCGGGRNECLREIELICNAFNIKYRRIDKFIY